MRITSDAETCLAAVTAGEEETRALAAALAAELRGGEVLSLRGDLGAGKTVFVQGLACGLGACEPATSPTFVIVRQYPARLLLSHVDLYRLDREGVEGLGLEDLIALDSVVAIEWAERLPQRLRRRVSFDIAIDFGAGEGERVVRISASGRAVGDVLGRMAAALGSRSAGGKVAPR